MGLLSRYLRTVSPEAMRFVGTPQQKIIMFPEELEEEIRRNNGKNPCYISLCNVSKSGDIILPAILFDFDAKGKSFSQTTDESKRLSDFYREKGFPFIRLFTGNRGFHVILFIKPLVNPTRTLVEMFQKGVIDFLSLETADPQVACGDARRMTRIPGCIHPKSGMVSTVVEEYIGSQQPDLEQLVLVYGATPKRKFDTVKMPNRITFKIEGATTIERAFLKKPCYLNAILYKNYPNGNPVHHARFSATAHLLSQGVDVDSIFEFYEEQGWPNFDPEKTFYHITNIKDGLESGAWSVPSCNNMIQSGLCMKDGCPVYKCQPKGSGGRLLFG